MYENEVGTIVVECAIGLHRELGPGLLESVYELALARRIEARGLRVARQVAIPIHLDGLRFDEGFRADLLIENLVLVEIKCVERLHPVHSRQLLTYLKFSDRRLGYLLNFANAFMKDGITRIVRGELESTTNDLRERRCARTTPGTHART